MRPLPAASTSRARTSPATNPMRSISNSSSSASHAASAKKLALSSSGSTVATNTRTTTPDGLRRSNTLSCDNTRTHIHDCTCIT